ncbi:DUF883 family protein [Phragmitibacter flavus]|nr:DUF883 family protein [Phragmitibacter flavus]
MSDETQHPFEPAAETPGTDPFAAAKASAKKAAEELRAAATAKAQEFRGVASAKAQEFRGAAEQKAHEFRETAGEKAHQVKDYADKTWTDARSQALDYTAEAERYTREKPLQALLAALGVGIILGVILKKR